MHTLKHKLFKFGFTLMLGLLAAAVFALPALAQGPVVQNIDPLTNTVTAPLDSSVVLTYSADIDSATVTSRTVAVHSMMRGLVTGTHSVTGNVITVNPVRDFFPGELGYASATTQTTDLGGTHPISSTVWQFNAAAGVGPGEFDGISRNIFGTYSGYSGAVALGDVDGDGDLDVAVGNYNFDSSYEPSWVYLNNGDGTFDRTGNSFGTNADTTESVALGDVDGDGDLDVVVGNWYESGAVYLNNGDGTFAASGDSFGTDGTSSLALGDLNGDGHLDIVVGRGNGNMQNGFHLNNGDGTFDPTGNVLGSVLSSTTSVALGDVDGDGDLDVVVGNGWVDPPDVYGQQNEIYLNNGDGSFAAIGNGLGTAISSTTSVALGDLDGDGDLDVAVGNYDEANEVYLNNGDGTFVAGNNMGSVISATYSLALGDVDGDGDLDAVVGNSDYRQRNEVYLNNGDGTFDPTAKIFGPDDDDTQSVALGDLDGDGDLDIAVGNEGDSNAVYLNALPPAVACPPVFHVDRNVSGGSNNGDSWNNAFSSLQTGLAAARECAGPAEIWVARGVYTPGLTVYNTFDVRSGVALYGGFAATETVRTERDWQANPTILSGDIGGDDTTDATGVVTHTDNISGTNAYHVLLLTGLHGTPITAGTRLDGFTVTGGQATGSRPYDRGGGLLCDGKHDGCSPTLANVSFSGNLATVAGGAMYSEAGFNSVSNPSLTNVTFAGNSAGSFGGAMFNHGLSGPSSPSLVNVTFSGNSAKEGGAMYNTNYTPFATSRPSLVNVTFTGNSAESGGAMYNYGLSRAIIPSLVNVIFSDNSATKAGGAMYNFAFATNSPNLTNVVFTGNSAPDGGAMYNNGYFAASSPNLTNTTFYNNSANNGGAMYNSIFYGTSSPNLANVIMWGNSVITAGAQIYNDGATPIIKYSLVPSSTADISNTNSGIITWGAGNITDTAGYATSDIFLDATNDNLRLAGASPAINAGDNAAINATGVITDLAGNPRIQTGIVDMGAYEALPPDVTLVKTVSPTSVKPGDSITYTLTFSNAGGTTAAGMVITDSVPISVTNVSVISSGAVITDTGATSAYVWQVADLAPDTIGVITLTGALTEPLVTGYVFTNTAEIACTGDGNDTNNRSEAGLTIEESPPIADAGDDQTVTPGKEVQLDGSDSRDPNGDPFIYGWRQTGGSPSVTLSSSTAISPTFTAPDEETVLTFTLTVTDTDTGTLVDSDTVVVTVSKISDLYFPLIFKNHIVAPDLVITALSGDSSGINLTIKNIGNTTVVNDYWLDVYFNPTETPSLNHEWETIAEAGAAWGVTKNLAPGDELTLTVDDEYYDADESSSSFPDGATVYGYVDSINYATTYGNVWESDEGNNLWPGSGSAEPRRPAAPAAGPISGDRQRSDSRLR